MWKTLSIVAAILTAGAAYFSHKNVAQFKNERVLLAIAKENLSRAEAHLADVSKALTEDTDGRKKTETERDQIVAETDGLKPKIDAVVQDIEEKQAELDSLTARWTEVKKQVDDAGGIELLKTQLTTLSEQKLKLENDIAALKNQTAGYLGRFDSLNQLIADLRRKETWQARGIIQDGFNARIVQVDRPYGFITINAGNTRGVVSGATLDIRRGGSQVGQAKVTNVEQSYAVADLVGVSAADVEVGDTVTVSAASSSKNWRPDQPTPRGGTPAAPGTPAAGGAESAPSPADIPADEPLDPFADPAATTPTEPANPSDDSIDPFN